MFLTSLLEHQTASSTIFSHQVQQFHSHLCQSSEFCSRNLLHCFSLGDHFYMCQMQLQISIKGTKDQRKVVSNPGKMSRKRIRFLKQLSVTCHVGKTDFRVVFSIQRWGNLIEDYQFSPCSLTDCRYANVKKVHKICKSLTMYPLGDG